METFLGIFFLLLALMAWFTGLFSIFNNKWPVTVIIFALMTFSLYMSAVCLGVL